MAIMNVVVLGILCSPASNSAVSFFVRSGSWGRPMCLFRQTTGHHLLALNHEIVLVLRSSLYCQAKTEGFELLSFVETRHVGFMLQAFPLNDTCRCITTGTSITQSEEVRLWNLHCFLNCLGGRYLASQYHCHIGSWDDLDHLLLDLRDLVVNSLFNSAPLIAHL